MVFFPFWAHPKEKPYRGEVWEAPSPRTRKPVAKATTPENADKIVAMHTALMVIAKNLLPEERPEEFRSGDDYEEEFAEAVRLARSAVGFDWDQVLDMEARP